MPRIPTSSKILIGVIVVLLVVVGTPNLLRSRYAASSRADFTVSEDEVGMNYGSEEKVAAGGGGGGARLAMAKLASEGPEGPERKIIRTAGFELIVDDVPIAKDSISKIAERSGGFVESSESSKTREGLQRARVTVRVPQSRLDEVRDEIRAVAGRVQSDKTEARDV